MQDAIRRRAQALHADALIRLRAPVELALTHAVRRLARRRPDVFHRLGPFQGSAYLIAPDELPVAFRLEPRGRDGRVRVVAGAGASRFDVRIVGPLLTLVCLFDGSRDADSAFFSRAVRVEGDTEAAMALHNALEAAELDLADLAGLAAPALRRIAGAADALRRRAFAET